MLNESYECRYCGKLSVITHGVKERKFILPVISPDTRHCYVFFTEVSYCLSMDCRKISSKITAFRSNSPVPSYWEKNQLEDYSLNLSKEPPTLRSSHYSPQNNKHIDQETELSAIKTWDLLPGSIAKPFPDYIPEKILEDYREAYAIKDLSPKAAATLTRRCLQGMIWDFFGIKKRNLKEEIDAIEGKDYVSDEVWKTIQVVREMGNIGAHMEKDTNLIINIDSGEAEKLVWLIEYLVEEWYVVRNKRQKRLKEIQSMGEEKKIARTARTVDTGNDSRKPPLSSPAK